MAARALVIVESPGKTKKINAILGAGYLVRASLGHVRDLPARAAPGSPPGLAGLDVAAGWRPAWEVIPTKVGLVAALRQAAGGGVIYLATDLDREGEAIAWHLRDLLGGSEDRYRRVTFSEITPDAIRAAFASPRAIDYALVDAQQARRFLDRVVGYTVSPLLSRRFSARLSAGRVQSAALRILVDRDERIRVFQAAPFYGADLRLPPGPGFSDPVVAQLVDEEGNVRRFDAQGDADAFVSRFAASAFRLAGVDVKHVVQNPRPPFTTSTLQQAASARLKMSVSDTMAWAQKLYEAGRITYMRSDAVALSAPAIAAARTWLVAAFGAGAVPDAPPTYDAKAGAQEAHEAIRPTDPAYAGTDLDDEAHRRLYDLIRRRLLASQMRPARLRSTIWRVVPAATGASEAVFVARGRVVVDAGFHRVLPPASAVDEPPAVPDLEPGHVWPARVPLEVSASWTKPPPRFTEATLVAELESAGVGRPSTYANTLKVLVERGYVFLDGRVFVVAPLGRLVCRALVRHFPGVTDVGFTADLERSLDEVAAGTLAYRVLLDRFYKAFSLELDSASADRDLHLPPPGPVPDLLCSSCNGPMALLFDAGAVAVACRYCAPAATLAWAPRRASRRVARRESDERAAAEQAAADQRLQARCAVCGGAQQRWKLSLGGYLHLCQAWPLCAGLAYEPGRKCRSGASRPSKRRAWPRRGRAS